MICTGFKSLSANPCTSHASVLPHRSNVSTIVTGHADGCIRSYTVAESPRIRHVIQPEIASVDADVNSTYCPPPDGDSPDASVSIKALIHAKVQDRGRQDLVLAWTENNRIIVMHGKPWVVRSNSTVLHVWYGNRQVRISEAALVGISVRSP